MKRKLLILLTMLLIPLFTLSGEESNKASKETFMKVYEIQNTYSEHDTVKITIYYFPITKQARVIYIDEYNVFDCLDAIVSLKRCLEKFTKQIGCYHYKLYRDYEERSFKFKNKKYTKLTAYFNFYE